MGALVAYKKSYLVNSFDKLREGGGGALVTYMKSFYQMRSEIQGKIK